MKEKYALSNITTDITGNLFLYRHTQNKNTDETFHIKYFYMLLFRYTHTIILKHNSSRKPIEKKMKVTDIYDLLYSLK